MNVIKKFLVFIVLAVIFAVGGYFIGAKTGSGQAASIYQSGTFTGDRGAISQQQCSDKAKSIGSDYIFKKIAFTDYCFLLLVDKPDATGATLVSKANCDKVGGILTEVAGKPGWGVCRLTSATRGTITNTQ